LALCLPLARSAQAEGGAAARPAAHQRDHVAQLTHAELAFLRARIKGWDKLDPSKKQRIARNVVRIRSLKPEQRRAFVAKLGRLRAHRRGGPERFHDHATVMLVNRALGGEARKLLGRRFEARLRSLDITHGAFEMAFSMTFWRQVTASLAAQGEPPAPDALPDGLAPYVRREYAQTYAEYARQRDRTPPDARKVQGERRRLWFKLAEGQGDQVRRELQQTDLKGEAYVAAFGSRMRAQWGSAFDAALADPDALLETAERIEVRRAVRRLLARTGRPDREESALLATLLSRLAGAYAPRDGEAASSADAALRLVLKRELHLDEAELAALPPAGKTQARAAWLAQVLRARLGLRISAGRGRHDVRRRPLLGTRPQGVSEADWTIFKRAVARRLGAGGRPPALDAKPEGMSEEGWARIRAAVAKRWKARQRGGGASQR
jgi:hypothetical protein